MLGSGYLGYVDSNQVFFTPISGSKMSPNPRVINLHETNQLPTVSVPPLSSEVQRSPFVTFTNSYWDVLRW